DQPRVAADRPVRRPDHPDHRRGAAAQGELLPTRGSPDVKATAEHEYDRDQGVGQYTRTRPVVRAMSSPWPILLVSALLGWVLVVPDYLIYTLSAAVPVAILGLGLLVLQGWTREISLCSAGLFGTTAYYFSWLDRPTQEGKGLHTLI